MIIKIQNKCPERGTKVRLIKLTALFVISLKPLIGSPSVFLSCNCPSSPRYWLCRKMPIILSKIDPRNPSIVIKIIPLKPNSGRAKKDNKRLPTRPATSPGQDTPPDNPLGIALPVKILKTLPLLIIPISDEKVSDAAAENTANASRGRKFISEYIYPNHASIQAGRELEST